MIALQTLGFVQSAFLQIQQWLNEEKNRRETSKNLNILRKKRVF